MQNSIQSQKLDHVDQEIERLNQQFLDSLLQEDMTIDINRDTTLGKRKNTHSLDDIVLQSPRYERYIRVYVSENILKCIYLITQYLSEFNVFNNLICKFNLLVPSKIHLTNFKIVKDEFEYSVEKNIDLLTDNVQRLITMMLGTQIELVDDKYEYLFNNEARYILCEYWDNQIELTEDIVYEFLTSLMKAIIHNIFALHVFEKYVDCPAHNIRSYYCDLMIQNTNVSRYIADIVFEYIQLFDNIGKNNSIFYSKILQNLNIPVTDHILQFKKDCKFKKILSVKMFHCILFQLEEIEDIKNIKIENFKKFLEILGSPLFYIFLKYNTLRFE